MGYTSTPPAADEEALVLQSLSHLHTQGLCFNHAPPIQLKPKRKLCHLAQSLFVSMVKSSGSFMGRPKAPEVLDDVAASVELRHAALTLPLSEDSWAKAPGSVASALSLAGAEAPSPAPSRPLAMGAASRGKTEAELTASRALRDQAGLLPVADAWPDVVASRRGRALLCSPRPSEEDLRRADAEPAATAAGAALYRWWVAACEPLLEAAAKRVDKKRWALAPWSPCLLPTGRPLKAAHFDYSHRCREAGVELWRQSLALPRPDKARPVAAVVRSGPTDGALRRLPGRPILCAHARVVWRSSVALRGKSGGAGQDDGWASAERLNTYASFTLASAKYILILVEVSYLFITPFELFAVVLRAVSNLQKCCRSSRRCHSPKRRT